MIKDEYLDAWAEAAEIMADTARGVIRQAVQKPFSSEIKSDGSPVTEVDKAVEDRVREIIGERFPDHGVIGEERDDQNPDAEFVWAIDPIDGTLPFLAGIPVFGTLIALLQGDTPLIGVIEMPMTGERWLGVAGKPSMRNGNPVSVRECPDLSSALMSTSNPDYYGEHDVGALNNMRDATKLTVYGGSCMSYAQIASGRIDIGMDVLFDVYDYLALVPVIQGAGGAITDWNGQPLNRTSGDRFVAAGDRRVHEQALELLA